MLNPVSQTLCLSWKCSQWQESWLRRSLYSFVSAYMLHCHSSSWGSLSLECHSVSFYLCLFHPYKQNIYTRESRAVALLGRAKPQTIELYQTHRERRGEERILGERWGHLFSRTMYASEGSPDRDLIEAWKPSNQRFKSASVGALNRRTSSFSSASSASFSTMSLNELAPTVSIEAREGCTIS